MINKWPQASSAVSDLNEEWRGRRGSGHWNCFYFFPKTKNPTTIGFLIVIQLNRTQKQMWIDNKWNRKVCKRKIEETNEQQEYKLKYFSLSFLSCFLIRNFSFSLALSLSLSLFILFFNVSIRIVIGNIFAKGTRGKSPQINYFTFFPIFVVIVAVFVVVVLLLLLSMNNLCVAVAVSWVEVRLCANCCWIRVWSLENNSSGYFSMVCRRFIERMYLLNEWMNEWWIEWISKASRTQQNQ